MVIGIISDTHGLLREEVKEDIDIVVYGHSHKSNIYTKCDILYINPGSVGPRRFNLQVTMVKLIIKNNNNEYEHDKVLKFNNYSVEIINIIN